MRAFLRQFDGFDWCVILGIGLIAAGAYFIFAPAALLVLGAGCIFVGWMGATDGRAEPSSPARREVR
jgi:hypothetical protein